MKKLFAVLAIFAGIFSANAQEEYAIKSSKVFWDNWYASINAGAITPFKGNLIGDMRPTVGVEVGRYLTPVFGLGAEYRAAINTTPSANIFDQTNLSGLMKFNLTNLFKGYYGEPRFFEMVLDYGIGWGHNFVCGWPYYFVEGLETGMVYQGPDHNVRAVKVCMRTSMQNQATMVIVSMPIRLPSNSLQVLPTSSATLMVHTTSYVHVSMTRTRLTSSMAKLTTSRVSSPTRMLRLQQPTIVLLRMLVASRNLRIRLLTSSAIPNSRPSLTSLAQALASPIHRQLTLSA